MVTMADPSAATEREARGPEQGRIDPVSAGLRARAERLFPGGVNSPVRAWRAVDGEAPILVRGEGPYVWDADGRRFIDYIGAFGPHLLGHAHPAVVRAVRAAAGDGGPFGATHISEIALAELIVAAMPSIEKLRFVSSGTEAVMSALRVARAATGRQHVITFAGGYHGHADGLLVRAGSGLATLGIPYSAGVDDVAASRTSVARYNDPDSVARLLESDRDPVAAVIVEPVAANMGVITPRDGFLEALRDLTRAAGALLVFDEVITGFRVARGGAQERYDVRPDLTVLGKVIGAGLPIGAYGGRADLMDLVAPAGPVYQAGTLAGHPLAMAAGIAMLERATPRLYARLERLGERLEQGLRAGAKGAGAAVAVSRVASLLTVSFRSRPPRDFDETQDVDRHAFSRFHGALVAAGVLIPPSQHEAWFMSAAHGEDVIDATIQAAEVAFRAVAGAR